MATIFTAMRFFCPCFQMLDLKILCYVIGVDDMS